MGLLDINEKEFQLKISDIYNVEMDVMYVSILSEIHNIQIQNWKRRTLKQIEDSIPWADSKGRMRVNPVLIRRCTMDYEKVMGYFDINPHHIQIQISSHNIPFTDGVGPQHVIYRIYLGERDIFKMYLTEK